MAEGQFLVPDQVDQGKENIGPQGYGKDVDGRVDVLAEPLGELFENNDGGISGTDEEHVHVFSQPQLHKAVQSEGHTAQHQEGKGCRRVILFPCSAPLGHTKEQAHKHQQHMPYAGVNGQKQMPMEQSGRLRKGNGAAQQIVQHHKAAHSPLESAGIQKGNKQAHVHGNAAELEGKLAPVIGVIRNHIIAEELLEYFGQGKNKAAEKQDPSGSFVADIPQLPGRETADSKADQCKQNMECAIGRRWGHGPGYGFKESV